MGVRLVAGRTFDPGDRFSERQVNWRDMAARLLITDYRLLLYAFPFYAVDSRQKE